MYRRYSLGLVMTIFVMVLYTVYMSFNNMSYEFDKKPEVSFMFDSSDEEVSKVVNRNNRKLSAMERPKKSLHCDVLPEGFTGSGQFKCVKFRPVPSALICIHSQWTDIYISHDLEHTGTWEPHVLNDFLDVMKRDSSLGVIDIGANIGVYTIAAAALGRQAVAVEPLMQNLNLLQKSVQMGHYQDQVVIVHNAVADIRTNATIRQSGDNQGDTRIEFGVERCIGACPPTVRTVLLNDLLEVIQFKRAVIKIDIQGYEHRAFVHSSKLLEQIYVPFIYMEWFSLGAHYKQENHTSTNKGMVQDLLRYLIEREYRPYSLDSQGATELNIQKWQSWPFDVVWRHLPSNKDYQQLLRNHFSHWP